MRLFHRKAIVRIGTESNTSLEIVSEVEQGKVTGLDISFEIKRTLGRDPNTCSLRIFNLREDNRNLITEGTKNFVSIEAGYRDGTSIIFSGDLTESNVTRKGPDVITEIKSEDGSRRHRSSRFNRSYGPGARVADVLGDIVDAMNIGRGNLDAAAQTLELEDLSQFYAGGVTFSGPARLALHQLTRSAGVRYSIQRGDLQILARNQALGDSIVILSGESGLVESPSRSNDGVIKARTLMIPDLSPGRKVRLESEFLSGDYRVETANYTGETMGTNWYINLEAKEL